MPSATPPEWKVKRARPDMGPKMARDYGKGIAPSMARAMQVGAIYRAEFWGRLVLLLCLLALWARVVGGSVAFAQEPLHPEDVRIQQMRVQVMPEFDDPRVLVIVQGRLAVSPNDLPVTVTFRLPERAQINQMATVNMQSAGTTMVPYETQPDPADARWQLVSYSLEGAHFFYEYYYDPIIGNVDKEFTYILNSYHPVDDVSVEIQEPKAAEGFSISPQAVASRLDQTLRLYYHQVALGALAAGQEASISVSYSKADPDPSLTWEQVMALQEGKRPPVPTVVEAVSGIRMPTEVYVFVGGALLILAGAFVGYRLRLGERADEEAHGDGPDLFCRMCGTTLKADASYCHQCGAMVLSASINLEQATAATAVSAGHSRERRQVR